VDPNELQATAKCKIEDYIIPQPTTVSGQMLLLRNDVDDEKVAGQLFAFMYRIMYGSRMLANALADYNLAGKTRSSCP
jgi:hypothetical protein